MSYPNDNYADAIEVSGASGSITPFHYDGIGDPATLEAGEARYGAGETLWWKWVAPSTGRYFFTTDGSPDDDGDDPGLDTKIAVFDSGGIGAADRIATNDDGGGNLAGSYYWNSWASFDTFEGETYFIQVDMYGSGETGTLHLSWGVAPAPPPSYYRYDNLSRPGAPRVRDGDVMEITGSDLGGTLYLEIGGVHLPFTLVDDSTIHFTVGGAQPTGRLAAHYGTGTFSRYIFSRALVHEAPLHIPAGTAELLSDYRPSFGDRHVFTHDYTVVLTAPEDRYTPWDVGHPYGSQTAWVGGVLTAEVTLDNENDAALSWQNGSVQLERIQFSALTLMDLGGLSPWTIGGCTIPKPLVATPAGVYAVEFDDPELLGWRIQLGHYTYGVSVFGSPDTGYLEARHGYGDYTIQRHEHLDLEVPTLAWYRVNAAALGDDIDNDRFNLVFDTFTPTAEQLALVLPSGYTAFYGYDAHATATCLSTRSLIAAGIDPASTDTRSLDIPFAEDFAVALDISARDADPEPFYGYVHAADYAADFVDTPYSATKGWWGAPYINSSFAVRYRAPGYTLWVDADIPVSSGGWGTGRTT